MQIKLTFSCLKNLLDKLFYSLNWIFLSPPKPCAFCDSPLLSHINLFTFFNKNLITIFTPIVLYITNILINILKCLENKLFIKISKYIENKISIFIYKYLINKILSKLDNYITIKLMYFFLNFTLVFKIIIPLSISIIKLILLFDLNYYLVMLDPFDSYLDLFEFQENETGSIYIDPNDLHPSRWTPSGPSNRFPSGPFSGRSTSSGSGPNPGNQGPSPPNHGGQGPSPPNHGGQGPNPPNFGGPGSNNLGFNQENPNDESRRDTALCRYEHCSENQTRRSLNSFLEAKKTAGILGSKIYDTRGYWVILESEGSFALVKKPRNTDTSNARQVLDEINELKAKYVSYMQNGEWYYSNTPRHSECPRSDIIWARTSSEKGRAQEKWIERCINRAGENTNFVKGDSTNNWLDNIFR